MAWVHFLETTGGLQNRTSRFLRKPNEWKLLINGHNDEVGSTTKRLGFVKFGDTFQSGKSVTSVMSGGQYLYGSSNNAGATATQLKYYNAGTWTASSGGTALPASVNVRFAPLAETKSVFIAGSNTTATAQSDFMVTQKATYAAPGTTANVTNAPRSKFIVRHRDRMYHGYCAENSNWSTTHWYNETVAVKPNRIVYSNAPSAGAVTYEDQGVSGYANFLDMDGDNTGIASNADQFIAWTPQSLWTLTGDTSLQWKRRYFIGCDSGYSVVNVDVYTFFYNRNGIYAYSGGKPEKISTKIQPIINAITSPSACFADSPDDDHYRLFCGSLTLEGFTWPNCCIQYTLSTNSWSVYSYTVPTSSSDTITSAGSWFDGTKQRVYIGSSAGQVYRLTEPADTTANQSFADGDQASEISPITFFARSAELNYDIPQGQKQASQMAVYATSPVGLKVEGRADPASSDGQFKGIGQVSKEIQTFPVPLNAGYWHQYQFTETSTNPPLALQGFSVDASQTTPQ